MPCRIRDAVEWSRRIASELPYCTAAHFVTLTYSDENITRNDLGHSVLVKRDVQKFIKRLRFENQKHTDMQLRYFLVGEYGGQTLRSHYHAIMFNIHPEVAPQLRDIWGKGHVIADPDVNKTNIQYVTKYITKVNHSSTSDHLELVKEFRLMSRRPPIGQLYVDDHKNKEYHSRDQRRTVTQRGGKTTPLSRFHVERFYQEADDPGKTATHFETFHRSERYRDTVQSRNEKLLEQGISPDAHARELQQQQLRQWEERNKRDKL